MKIKKQDIAVIFEVILEEGQRQEYLDIAANLKSDLEKIKGFISIERFYSINNPDKILSLSLWENEDAIKKWRNLKSHREAQSMGRKFIFKNYRIRISQTIRDYGMFMREDAPSVSKSIYG